ncbi:MAG: UDP-N-acetylmuramate dehydrogenase [Bacillota bacterium]
MEFFLKDGREVTEFVQALEGLSLQKKPSYQHSIKKNTTFRIGGTADIFLQPSSIDEIQKILELTKKYEIPVEVIGNGSNILVGDQGVLGVVLQIGSAFSEVLVDGNSITAKAGALFPTIGKLALQHGLTGFEGLSGIPSSVGGGVVMNAGAYGSELADVFVEVTVLTADFQLLKLTKNELEFGYRTSAVAKNNWLVLELKIELSSGDKKEIEEKMSRFAKERREKQPLQFPNAGSTFKRPQNHFAGQLIEEVGLKGASVGGAMVSELHAGFCVNKGEATAKEMMDLIAICRSKVKEKYDVDLDLEIKLVGIFE